MFIEWEFGAGMSLQKPYTPTDQFNNDFIADGERGLYKIISLSFNI